MEGFGQRTKGQQKTPLRIVLEELQESLPGGWVLEWHILNACDFGLPQHRKRVYIIGRFDNEHPADRIPVIQHFGSAPRLGQIIETQDTRERRDYSDIQRANIADWKKKFKREIQDSKYIGQFAVVDHSRTPSGRTKWSGTSVPDRCECLTAAGPALHVFSLGEGAESMSVDRPLRMTERAALQGFPRSTASLIGSESEGKRIYGNAMAVPVIGSVLGSILLWWWDTHLSHPSYPTTTPPSPLIPCTFVGGDSPLLSFASGSPEEEDVIAVEDSVSIDDEDSLLLFLRLYTC